MGSALNTGLKKVNPITRKYEGFFTEKRDKKSGNVPHMPSYKFKILNTWQTIGQPSSTNSTNENSQK